MKSSTSRHIARALSKFLLGHPDCQNFGRKFKPSFSGCAQHACGLASMHDLGLIAAQRTENGERKIGFEMYVGGGLGAVPYQAKLFDSFIPPEELLPLAQAIARVFARLWRKEKSQPGADQVSDSGSGNREIPGARFGRAQNPAARSALDRISRERNGRIRGIAAETGRQTRRFWAPRSSSAGSRRTSVRKSRRAMRWSPSRFRSAISPPTNCGRLRTSRGGSRKRRFARPWNKISCCAGSARTILPELWQALQAAGLAEPSAETILDIVTCPGTDTCKLGISSSRGLAAELRKRLAEKNVQLDEAVQNLHIKISGCFNSCGQHHVADLGFTA